MEPVLTSIADYVRKFAEADPRGEAVVFEDRGLSWAELETEVSACARALLHAGVAKGARVAMLSTSRPEYWTVFLATARIGAIWTGLNPRHRLDEYRYWYVHADNDVRLWMLAHTAGFDVAANGSPFHR